MGNVDGALTCRELVPAAPVGDAAWTVTWTAPALNHSGQFTECRASAFTADVREVQVVNVD
ncbi:hypothetical protein [Streptomyces sp. NPDC000133]|uniref:hypothetical protein n=1 Tax=Streptomyces sp. NPDC000133 TaxID=3364535 RepID=UPI0036743654